MTSTPSNINLLRISTGILALAVLALVAQHSVQHESSTILDELDIESEQLLRKFGSEQVYKCHTVNVVLIIEHFDVLYVFLPSLNFPDSLPNQRPPCCDQYEKGQNTNAH